jgi:dipeptidyl aminopeptidase/acylaminoacyl peptidase
MALTLPAALAAQSPGFTVEDVLSLRGARVAAASPDGGTALIALSTLRDRVGRDNSRFGDPTYVAPSVASYRMVDTSTGEARPFFDGPRQAASFTWSPDGSRIAFLDRAGDAYRLNIHEVERNRSRTVSLPADRVVMEDATLQWSADGRQLLFTMRTNEWHERARQRFLAEVDGPIVVRSSEEPFLSWEEIRRLSLEQIPALYDVASNRVEEILPASRLGSVTLTADATYLVYQEDRTDSTSYEQIFGRKNRLIVRPVGPGESRTLFEDMEGITMRWSGDNRSYVYAKENRTYFGTIDGGEPRQLTGDPPREPGEASPEPPADSAARTAERERRARERFTPQRLSHDGSTMLARNSQGYWLIDTATGSDRTMIVEVPEDDEENGDDRSPAWGVVAWSNDGDDVYLSYASRTLWERGLMHYDRTTGEMRELVKDQRYYTGVQLSDNGSRFILSIAGGNHPGDIHVANADFTDVRRLTESNPGIEDRLARTELLKYLDVDGNELYGVVYYPLGYRQGTPVPTVFIVYEEFFDDRFNPLINVLTSNGYAVVQPSVDLERGYPGEAWVKGVTSAANKLIEMGVADPARLGVHGTSYGGYATNLLVTQTDRFAAAINISGKVDMVSFYFDSPRLGTRNTHAPERSQDRIGATLWEQPQKYVQHSAVMFADRIDTPLLLMTGTEDHNVPERTTSEMFYALRRLGRRVEWVSYVNGGHGMPTSTEAEVRDYHERILAWYDRYLRKDDSTRATSEESGEAGPVGSGQSR